MPDHYTQLASRCGPDSDFTLPFACHNTSRFCARVMDVISQFCVSFAAQWGEALEKWLGILPCQISVVLDGKGATKSLIQVRLKTCADSLYYENHVALIVKRAVPQGRLSSAKAVMSMSHGI